MAPETPNRDIQRELVFQQIKDPISRRALRSCVPADQLVDYSNRYNPNQEKLAELVRKEGSNAFRYIFAVAAVAQNPTQLANTFGTLAVIENNAGLSAGDFTRTLDQAKADFLNSTISPAYVSDGARTIQAELIALWSKCRGERSKMNTSIQDNFINLSYIYQREERLRVNRFWSEAYLLTILDPKTPLALRTYLLGAAGFPLSYGAGTESYEKSYLERFAQGVSFWQHVNASWLYPDLLGQSSQDRNDTKDWEIAGLRRHISQIEQQLNQRPPQPQRDPNLDRERINLAAERQAFERERAVLEAERQTLRQTAAKLDELLKAQQEKLKVYREIGRHPLEALGIGITVWRSYSIEQRRQIVLQAYRAGAKKYHYQVPTSDPKYDPLLAELANKEFTRINNAYNYLNRNLEKNEF